MSDGPREYASMERRTGRERRSNFRRAIDALHAPPVDRPRSRACAQDHHADCPQFCLWFGCDVLCGCACHGEAAV